MEKRKMEKFRMLDILGDIKIINDTFKAFGKAKSYDKFCDIAIEMKESLKTVEVLWEIHDSYNDCICTEIYERYTDEDPEDFSIYQDKNYRASTIIMLDYECCYFESRNKFVVNRCGYAIAIDGQIYEDVNDAISFVNSLESQKDGINE
jgi:hypothetical protein